MGIARATALVATNMIGSGVLLAPALLAPYGNMSLIGWILTTIGALALALVFSRLSIWISNSGGPYTYVRHVFGDFVGFQMAWGYWISCWCGSVSLLLGTIQYVSVFWPEFAANQAYSMAFGVSMVWLFTYLNTQGLKESTLAGVIILLIKVVPLILIACFGIFYVDFSSVFSLENSAGISSLGEMSGVLLWAFIGLESATIPYDNVQNPKKIIPVATISGVLITAAVYILGSIVISGVLSHEELIASQAPYVDAARKIFGNGGYIFMFVTGIIGLVGSLNGWILLQGQVPYSAARENLFPKFFLKKNKNDVPVGVVFGSILMTIVFMLCFEKTLTTHLQTLIEVSVLSMLLPYFYSVVAYSYIAFKKKNELSDIEKFCVPLISIVAFIYSFLAICGAGKEIIFICFIAFLLSVPFYLGVKHSEKA